jgi:UDP-glucose 4-epimerase
VNGIDKLAAERFHLLYAEVHGLAISALRLTNVYGPRQRLVKEGLGFLPVFIRRALQDQTITVYGDGQQLRDCLHVDDVVRALAAAALSPDAVGQVFNLGHPDALALIDIARAVVDATEGTAAVELVPWPAAHQQIDIGSFQGDYSRAKRVLGWEPDVDFVDGITDTVAFYRDHPWYLSPT